MTIACENCGSMPSILQCTACCKDVPHWASFCPFCGEPIKKGDAAYSAEGAFDPSTRKLCPDGNCIGVLEEDGKCGICGKSENGEV